jgi:soluble lytic murein transglycosylase-like protein
MVWETEVAKAVSHWAPYYGVDLDPALIHAVIERESRHGKDPTYVYHHGVILEPDGDYSFGPMQIKGDTVRTVLRLGFPGEDLASHPALGIWYGTKEFARRMKALGGDPVKAVSAWNAGIGGVGRNPEYVKAVMALWNRYKGTAASLVPVLALAGLAFWWFTRRRRALAA